MSAEHSPGLFPASAQKIIGGLRHVIAELDELARDAPARWAERITWVTVTAEDVAGGIEAELIEDGSAAAREGSLTARARWWQADMPGPGRDATLGGLTRDSRAGFPADRHLVRTHS
jgi:hypothetical protein